MVSEVGVGSTFSLTIPLHYAEAHGESAEEMAEAEDWQWDESRATVLVVEDEPETRLIYEKHLRETQFQPRSVANLRQARAALRQFHPRAIVLDIVLRGEDSWSWLAELKADENTRDIPILVVSALEDRGKGLALGADAYCVKPLERGELLDQLQRLTGAPADRDLKSVDEAAQVVIIDDEPAARYVLSKLLAEKFCRVQEAENGAEGLRLIQANTPRLVFLDLNMPDLSGFEVLNRLKTDAATQSVPVAVVTSAQLTDADRRLLGSQTCAIIDKTDLSRERIEQLWRQVVAPQA